MKPPSRRRAEPSRFILKGPEEKQAVVVRSFCKGWSRKDQQNFLQALKQQQKFESDLDLTGLQKKVPKYSLQEIEDLIKTLKIRVLQRVFLQVQSQRREERKAKVPIEIWAELVEKVSGSHEKTVCSAFSQMLVIAATEPCSLIYSNPPQAIAIKTPARPSHPVSCNPKCNVQLWPSLLSTTPEATVLPRQIEKIPQPSSLDLISNPSAPTSLVASKPIQPDSSSSAVENNSKRPLDKAPSNSPLDPSKPNAPTTELSQVTSPSRLELETEPTSSSLSTLSTGSVSPLVTLPSNQCNPAQSEPSDEDSLHRPRVLKCIVNFDNIYEYIGASDSKPCKSGLTSMECAVLLDILMCLPEELPLLDCKALQHHLLQVHTQLCKAVKIPASFSNTGRNIPHNNVVDSAALTKQHGTAAGSCHPPGDPSSESSVTEPAKDKEDWASAGICPLNPLMVPVALLKRHSLDTNK